MITASKYVLLIAILVGVVFASSLAIEILPDGELWFITVVSSLFAYVACTKLGWLALVLVPFFPFLIFMLEMEQGYSDRYPFGVAIAAWLVFALAAIVGAWRWWKRLRNTSPSAQ
jgi:hypothetical protein